MFANLQTVNVIIKQPSTLLDATSAFLVSFGFLDSLQPSYRSISPESFNTGMDKKDIINTIEINKSLGNYNSYCKTISIKNPQDVA